MRFLAPPHQWLLKLTFLKTELWVYVIGPYEAVKDFLNRLEFWEHHEELWPAVLKCIKNPDPAQTQYMAIGSMGKPGDSFIMSETTLVPTSCGMTQRTTAKCSSSLWT
jgi:hypothetical protein